MPSEFYRIHIKFGNTVKIDFQSINLVNSNSRDFYLMWKIPNETASD